MSKLYKEFLKNAGSIMTGLALATGNAADIDATLKIGSPKTITATGRDPQESSKGHVSFVVDASGIGKIAYLRSTHLAIVFEGEAAADRECPYIRTDKRKPTYKELSPYIFRVETLSAQKEIKAVKDAGCLITESPPITSVLGGNKPQ